MDIQTQSSILQNAFGSQLNSTNNNPLLQQIVGQGIGTQQADPASSFKTALSNAFNEVTQSQHKAEAISRKALVGEASMTELIPAVLNAETTLKTVTTLRDRVVESYREILRTPI